MIAKPNPYAGTFKGKFITVKMLETLAMLRSTSPAAGSLSPTDQNRFLALSDKGLATNRAGKLVPTKAGIVMLIQKGKAT